MSDRLEEKLQVLRARADDYLGELYAAAELLMRARVLLRRRLGTRQLRWGLFIVDSTKRAVRMADECLKTTDREFDLLEYFLSRPGQVITREQLQSEVFHLKMQVRTGRVAGAAYFSNHLTGLDLRSHLVCARSCEHSVCGCRPRA